MVSNCGQKSMFLKHVHFAKFAHIFRSIFCIVDVFPPMFLRRCFSSILLHRCFFIDAFSSMFFYQCRQWFTFRDRYFLPSMLYHRVTPQAQHVPGPLSTSQLPSRSARPRSPQAQHVPGPLTLSTSQLPSRSACPNEGTWSLFALDKLLL